MEDKKRVLIVTQEMDPYVMLSNMSKISRELPLYLNDQNIELRILMPKFGVINERRHRLHEVVRLSGINIIIDEDDYPLIIKVASMPGSRLQVYFLDNEEFFKRKAIFGKKGSDFFDDNPERMIFFCKGAIETVKKFGWAPDIIHCHGWMTSLLPLYLRTAYKNEPIFNNSKIVYSVYDQSFDQELPDNFLKKAPQIQKAVSDDDLKPYADSNFNGLQKGAAYFSDAIIIGGESVNGDVREYIDNLNKPVLEYMNEEEENYLNDYHSFYEELMESKEVNA